MLAFVRLNLERVVLVAVAQRIPEILQVKNHNAFTDLLVNVLQPAIAVD